jgi:hypothetical protein
MAETRFSDRAAFWLGVAAVLAAIGIVPVSIAIGTRLPQADLWSDPAFIIGIIVEAVAVLALWWALTLHLAHGHASVHGTPTPPAAADPSPPRNPRPDKWLPGASDLALFGLTSKDFDEALKRAGAEARRL